MLVAAAAAVAAIRDAEDNAGRVADAVGSISVRVESLRQAQEAIGRSGFNGDAVKLVTERYRQAAGLVRRLKDESAHLARRLGEEVEGRGRDAAAHDAEEARLKAELQTAAAREDRFVAMLSDAANADHKLQETASAQEAEIARLAAREKELSASLQTATADAGKLRETAGAAEALVKDLADARAQAATLEEALAAEQMKTAAAESMAAQARQECGERNAKAQAEVDALRAEAEGGRTEIDTLKKGLAEEQARSGDARARIEEAGRGLAEARGRLRTVEGELAAARTRAEALSDAEASSQVFRDQVQTLKQMLDRKSRDLEALLRQNAEYRSALDAAQRRAGEAPAHDEAGGAMEQEMIGLQLELGQRDERIAELEEAVRGREAEIAVLKDSVAELNRQVQALTSARLRVTAPPAAAGAPSARPATGPYRAPSQPFPHREGPAGVPSAGSQDLAHASARQMARVLVSTFIRNRERDIVETLKSGTFRKAFEPIIRELRRSYDSRVPPHVTASNDYFREELDAAIDALSRRI